MELSLFDLHCDTPTAIYAKKQDFLQNDCHVSLKKAAVYSSYRQIMAIWSNKRLSNAEAWEAFLKITDYLANDCSLPNFPSCTVGYPLPNRSYWLAVEDARLLDGKLERLGILFDRGVRFLTPVWGGSSCIGGAHNTEDGLTEFGKQVLDKCFSCGIIPDISHASGKTADEILERAAMLGKTAIATHSNSYSICPHSRNLTDARFRRLKELGGLVGLCLCPPHLSTSPSNASLDDAVHHIEHWLSLGGEDTVALGCDFDGTDLPVGIDSIADIVKLADRLSSYGYSDELICKLFYKNAENFVKNTLH